MPEVRRFLCGLRRPQVSSGALARWVAERGITGAVWLPEPVHADDAGGAVASLVAAGARPDVSLLRDLAITDVRSAADILRPVHRTAGGTDGYVAVWLEPAADVSRAVGAARALYAEIRRENVAVAFAWTPARAQLVAGAVAAGVPVAVSGQVDRAALAAARARGMERRRRDDPEAEEVPVLLLGRAGWAEEAGPAAAGSAAAGPAAAAQGTDAADAHLLAVELVRETGLLAPGRGEPPRLPATPADEEAAFAAAVAALAERARAPVTEDSYHPEPFRRGASYRAQVLERDGVGERIWSRDHTLWRDDPTEVADRLGWLDVAETVPVEEIIAFAHQVRGGVSRVVLCGMGGSSLAAEAFAAVAGGGTKLVVCDTTHPEHLAAIRGGLNLDATLFVVASKSGTTVETMSHLEYFWAEAGERGERFVAITDPGTPLAALAAERGFRRVFLNPPDIGGRFSALSFFGLVPAALCGIDVRVLRERALRMARRCAACVPAEASPGLRLGAALGDAALDGQDKLTLLLPPRLAVFGAWVEQLVAESTGKEGRGVLPVEDEELGGPEVYGPDRLFVAYALGGEPFPPALEALEAAGPVVRIRLPDPQGVAGEMVRWEFATAVLGRILGINPFDQPDVEAAKRYARQALEGGGTSPPEPGEAAALLDGLAPPAYLAIQAFCAPSAKNRRRLQAVRMRIRDRFRVATTLGFGPRFLHSTGQLHKGGPAAGVFLQVFEAPRTDLPVPGRPYSFGQLFAAQADGDLRALREAGRRAARVDLAQLEALVP